MMTPEHLGSVGCRIAKILKNNILRLQYCNHTLFREVGSKQRQQDRRCLSGARGTENQREGPDYVFTGSWVLFYLPRKHPGTVRLYLANLIEGGRGEGREG